MRDVKAYSYAVIRVVPRVERDEFVNAGVILFSQELRFLAAEICVPRERVLTLWPEADLDTIERHAAAVARVCSGQAEAGPIGRLSLKDRFYWLTAPRSTILQTSPIRNGLTGNAGATLQHLVERLVT